MSKPFLCRIGLHEEYRYLPRVGGDLGEICIACRRCGYGKRYFDGSWDITPKEVQKDIAQEAQIQYGYVLGLFKGVSDPLAQMQMAYDMIKDKFTPKELAPIEKELKRTKEIHAKLIELTRATPEVE